MKKVACDIMSPIGVGTKKSTLMPSDSISKQWKLYEWVANTLGLIP